MMRSCLTSLIFIFILSITACGKESAAPANIADTTASITNSTAEPGIIRMGMFSYLASGLPNHYPSIVVMANGRVQAVREDISDISDALDAIAKGDEVLDNETRRQEMQAAFENFLASDQMTPESLVNTDQKFILLISPDESMGECPPCIQVFGAVDANTLIGNFTILKMILENR